MKPRLYILVLAIALPVCLYATAIVYEGGQGAGGAPAGKPAAAAHFTAEASGLQWTPLFLGLERAVVSGDPAKPGVPFVMRLRASKGAQVPAHYHPVDENVTVLAGRLRLGKGDKYDAKALHAMTAGSYSFMPANMRHFGRFAPGTVVQIHGVGPFTITFVNPADDPRTAATK
ncbi:MAG: cupin domain-containing protein [Terriglobales bacterium]